MPTQSVLSLITPQICENSVVWLLQHRLLYVNCSGEHSSPLYVLLTPKVPKVVLIAMQQKVFQTFFIGGFAPP